MSTWTKKHKSKPLSARARGKRILRWHFPTRRAKWLYETALVAYLTARGVSAGEIEEIFTRELREDSELK